MPKARLQALASLMPSSEVGGGFLAVHVLTCIITFHSNSCTNQVFGIEARHQYVNCVCECVCVDEFLICPPDTAGQPQSTKDQSDDGV